MKTKHTREQNPAKPTAEMSIYENEVLMIREAIEKVTERIDLSEDEMRACFEEMMSGEAASADIKASQDITHPEVIDGRIDTTLYQIGPLIVGGNIAFPLVHEGAAAVNLVADEPLAASFVAGEDDGAQSVG